MYIDVYIFLQLVNKTSNIGVLKTKKTNLQCLNTSEGAENSLHCMNGNHWESLAPLVW